MLKLKCLKINRYRNVKPGCELRFDDGFNLMLGQNASGKTTLLALISAACRSSFDGLRDDEFDIEYELANELFRVRVRVHRRESEWTIREPVFRRRAFWVEEFDVLVEVNGSNEEFYFSSKTPDVKAQTSLTGKLPFIAPLLGEAMKSLQGELMDAYFGAYRFDESLDTFAAITGRRTEIAGPATPPIAYHDSLWANDFGPGVIIGELVARFDSGGAPELPVGKHARGILGTLVRCLGASGITIRSNIETEESGREGRPGFFDARGLSFDVHLGSGVAVHHDLLSYGQKRLISFLYYVASNKSFVIADELVNGLHHQWIEACMEEIGERQAFLTSQNPLLFDYASFESVTDVQSSFVICAREMVEGRELMVWRNMSRDEAETFFSAYEVGIEHIGDILITRGLW